MISRADDRTRKVLKGAGFVGVRETYPLWILHRTGSTERFPEFSKMSFLDADVGYRF